MNVKIKVRPNKNVLGWRNLSEVGGQVFQIFACFFPPYFNMFFSI